MQRQRLQGNSKSRRVISMTAKPCHARGCGATSPVLKLQQTAGNQGVQRLLADQDITNGLSLPPAPPRHATVTGPSPACAARSAAARGIPVQTKLEVSTPGDPLEQEADRVAHQVMHMPQSTERPDPPCKACAGNESTCPTCAAKMAFLSSAACARRAQAARPSSRPKTTCPRFWVRASRSMRRHGPLWRTALAGTSRRFEFTRMSRQHNPRRS